MCIREFVLAIIEQYNLLFPLLIVQKPCTVNNSISCSPSVHSIYRSVFYSSILDAQTIFFFFFLSKYTTKSQALHIL